MTNSIKTSPLEFKLVRDIVKEYPELSEIIKNYFGEGCLKREGFRVLSLGMACLLFGVDQGRLARDIREVQYLGANKK